MERCALCPGKNNCIPPNGLDEYGQEIVFIGEAPGGNENRRRKVFIGKAGDEVNGHYLPLAGLRRDKSYFTNAIRCLPDTPDGKIKLQSKAHVELLESCAAQHLYPDLQRLRPKLIVAMGAFANYAVAPGVDLELEHGRPTQTPYGRVFHMYHPAGGIHEPKKMLTIRTDWDRLRKYLRGRLRIAVDEYAGQEDYRALDMPDEVDEVLDGFWNLPMACDTETIKGGGPFCATFSCQPGTGYLIRSKDERTLAAFQRHLNRWRGRILFHNWLFDRRVVRDMGLRFPEDRITDTMLMAFHLGNIPQGLKALAYRELGMKMKDFDDVVAPHSKLLVLDYYRYAQVETWPKPEQQLIRDEFGKLKIKQPQSFNTKLKRFFTDYGKDPDKNVFEMWTKNWVELHEQVEAEIGPWPGKCISHVPFEDVIAYACRDADATLRLWPVLKHMQKRMRKTSQENWGEAA